MYNIAICIATYKRKTMLKRLIESIWSCNINKEIIKNIKIIIVDNDIDKSAENIFLEQQPPAINNFTLHYFCHPQKGISNVRNELIRQSLLFSPDYIIFIDDDEYATSEWLNELVKTIIVNEADAARGPVIADLEKSIPNNIKFWFIRESYHNNKRLYNIKTGNLILRVSSLKKYNIWFDPRFNIIGSGDSYFGIQILKKGAKVFWASNAVAYETIPSNRANLKWLIKRTYRLSSTYSYVLKLEKRYLMLIKKIIVSFVYVGIGSLGLLLTFLPIKRKYWGVLKLSEGIGGLMGGMYLYKEYK